MLNLNHTSQYSFDLPFNAEHETESFDDELRYLLNSYKIDTASINTETVEDLNIDTMVRYFDKDSNIEWDSYVQAVDTIFGDDCSIEAIDCFERSLYELGYIEAVVRKVIGEVQRVIISVLTVDSEPITPHEVELCNALKTYNLDKVFDMLPEDPAEWSDFCDKFDEDSNHIDPHYASQLRSTCLTAMCDSIKTNTN